MSNVLLTLDMPLPEKIEIRMAHNKDLDIVASFELYTGSSSDLVTYGQDILYKCEEIRREVKLELLLDYDFEHKQVRAMAKWRTSRAVRDDGRLARNPFGEYAYFNTPEEACRNSLEETVQYATLSVLGNVPDLFQPKAKAEGGDRE